MHRRSAAPFVDLRLEDGETLLVGKLRFRVIETPGHTDDSMSLRLADRVLTGDALLIGGTGRTDLPTGDAEALYDSLFGKLLRLPDETLVFPAHDYKQRTHSTIGAERATNPRLQAKRAGGVRRADARAGPGDAAAPDRGAAHQPERRQDRQAADRRGGARHRVHVDGRGEAHR